MNLKILKGDIFVSSMQTLVNPINTEGAMGAGLALTFKKKFPGMFEDYVRRCREGEVRIGEPYLYKGASQWVLNFPTKQQWRDASRIYYISSGLHFLLAKYEDWGITSIAVPSLGCGKGNLEYKKVEPILLDYLSRFKIPVELYLPLE